MKTYKTTYRLFFLLTIFVCFENCATWKGVFTSSGNINDAVNNAVTDFLHTSKLSKRDTIFDVYIHEKEDIFIVSVGGADNKIFPSERYRDGIYDEVFPTRYIIRNEKLFYWTDTTQTVTQDIISVLEKYNHIDTLWWATGGLPPAVINDGYEAIVYFFCKNDLRNYKKKRADNIRRHYRTPQLKCK